MSLGGARVGYAMKTTSSDGSGGMVASVQFLGTDSVPNEMYVLSRDRTQVTNCECHDLLG